MESTFSKLMALEYHLKYVFCIDDRHAFVFFAFPSFSEFSIAICEALPLVAVVVIINVTNGWTAFYIEGASCRLQESSKLIITFGIS